jgi:thiamine biosynthesis lipoprotein
MRLMLLSLVLCAAVAPRPARADSSPDRLHPYRTKVMGTVVNLTLWSDDQAAAARAAEAVFKEFDRVDRLMSSWLPDSAVARINASAGKAAVVVDPEVFALIERAQRESKRSGGAFDITIGSFRGLWKFDQDRDGSIPTVESIKQRLPLVGYRGVVLNRKKHSVKLRKVGSRITLGGIAKGYAVDRAVAILHKLGFVDFILQAGGDLYAGGQKSDRKWRVGIRDPRGQRTASFAVTEIQDATFSTSGDYERSVIKDGRRYHHILDPKTGYPATGCRSVTVLTKDALTADIWSTTLFVMGPDRGMKVVESRKDLEAVFVDDKNQVHISSGLKGRLKVLRPPTDAL